VEIPENIGVLSFSEGLKKLAGRQGVSAAALGNPNRDNELRRKPLDRSDLAFSDSFVGFHLFASIFWFCQRNDTRNVTHRESLLSFSRRELYAQSLRLPQHKGVYRDDDCV
jgi:hypothetical protein